MEDTTAIPMFRTKTGTCTIRDGRIVLERSNTRGKLANALGLNSVAQFLVVYAILALTLLGFAAHAFLAQKTFVGVFASVVALMLFRGIWKSRGLSAVPEIPIASVTSVESHAPVPPVTRGHFVVHFKQANRSLRRLIILPGVAEGGSAEFTKALAAFQAAGISVQQR